MEDLNYRLWCVVDKCLERNESSQVSFYGFLDLCKRECDDASLFIEADVEDIDIAIKLYYILINQWMVQYRSDFYNIVKSELCYSIVCHLFEEEDFVQVFKDAEGIINEMFNLKSLEHEECGNGYSPHRSRFNRIYAAVARRLKVSIA